MRVHLHTLCWNDRRMIDFFFRHYEPWVDCFYILDDGSTDGTREYLEARQDVVLGDVTRIDSDSWVRSAQHIYNNDWKRSVGEADWVVVANIDEHLHHPSMRDYLAHLLDEGVTVVPALGYQMISDKLPAPDSILWRDCRMGAPSRDMSKTGIFRPERIRETNYGPGRHEQSIEGEVVLPMCDEVVNLHYKYLGVSETRARHKAQAARLGATDWANRWGYHYGWTLEELQAYFDQFKSALVDVTSADHHQAHPEPRWWRAGL